MRRSRSLASNSPTGFARDNSRLAVAFSAAVGRGRRNGRWRSHRRGTRSTKRHHPHDRNTRDAPEPIQQYIAKSTAALRGYAANHRNITVSVETALESLHLPRKLDLFWISQNYHDLHNTY